MHNDEQYALSNVVKHVQYFIQKIHPTQKLTLEYKFAKVNQPVQGNKKFQNILQDSHQDIIIMNGDRQIDRKNYVHLKSMTFLNEFNWFQDNLQTLQTVHKIQVTKKQKVQLTVMSDKVSYDCMSGSWTYKSRRPLFRPCYEGVKNGQLFRIGLISDYEGVKQANKKVDEMMKKGKKRAIKQEKQQPYNGKYGVTKKPSESKSNQVQNKQSQKQLPYDPRDNVQAPFRFKTQETYHLNNCCALVMTQVYQVRDIPLYEQMCLYIKLGAVFPLVIEQKCKSIFRDYKDELAYEVEFRFDPGFVREMGDLDEDEVEKIMRSGISVLLALVKDPVEFFAQEVVKNLEVIDGK